MNAEETWGKYMPISLFFHVLHPSQQWNVCLTAGIKEHVAALTKIRQSQPLLPVCHPANPKTEAGLPQHASVPL